MKNLLLIFLTLGLVWSCSKDENTDSIETCDAGPAQHIAVMQDVILTTDTEYWYLERNEMGGGSVNLHLAGAINADSATIRSYGDGLITENPLDLNEQGEFDIDLTISFTANTLHEGIFKSITEITVYRSATERPTITLESCELMY